MTTRDATAATVPSALSAAARALPGVRFSILDLDTVAGFLAAVLVLITVLLISHGGAG